MLSSPGRMCLGQTPSATPVPRSDPLSDPCAPCRPAASKRRCWRAPPNPTPGQGPPGLRAQERGGSDQRASPGWGAGPAPHDSVTARTPPGTGRAGLRVTRPSGQGPEEPGGPRLWGGLDTGRAG